MKKPDIIAKYGKKWWAILTYVIISLLIGAGIGASGNSNKTNTTTVTDTKAVTAPTKTVTMPTNTVTVTQTVITPAPAPTPQVAPASSPISDGTFVVGKDIQPGTYKTNGGENCYWARLSGFGGSMKEIIANGNPTGPAIVTIAPTDAGFTSDGCGTWTPQ